MIRLARRVDLKPPASPFLRQVLPVASVLLGSLMVLFPVIATAPELPPFGFLALIAWRLARSDMWPVWAPLPLGLFDDLFSGQPLGSAAACWTLTFLAIEAADRRFVWRDFGQDWTLAVLLIAGYLLAAWALAALLGGLSSPLLLVPQLAISALVYPAVARGCAMLDEWRTPR